MESIKRRSFPPSFFRDIYVNVCTKDGDYFQEQLRSKILLHNKNDMHTYTVGHTLEGRVLHRALRLKSFKLYFVCGPFRSASAKNSIQI